MNILWNLVWVPYRALSNLYNGVLRVRSWNCIVNMFERLYLKEYYGLREVSVGVWVIPHALSEYRGRLISKRRRLHDAGH